MFGAYRDVHWCTGGSCCFCHQQHIVFCLFTDDWTAQTAVPTATGQLRPLLNALWRAYGCDRKCAVDLGRVNIQHATSCHSVLRHMQKQGHSRKQHVREPQVLLLMRRRLLLFRGCPRQLETGASHHLGLLLQLLGQLHKEPPRASCCHNARPTSQPLQPKPRDACCTSAADILPHPLASPVFGSST